MARLGPLIRLRRHELDVAQKALQALVAKAERAAEAVAALDRLRAQEQALTEGSGEAMMAADFARWRQGWAARRESAVLAQQLAEAELDEAREALRAQFAAVKTLELTEAARLEAEAAARAGKERAALDEAALRRAFAAKGEREEG